MRRLALSLLATLALVGLAACSGAATPTPASSSAANLPSGAASAAGAAACATAPAGATAAVNVSIKDFKYNPQPVQAKVGDVVAWKNEDSALHSATMDSGACDTDSISSGSTGMLVFTAAGTYTYHCKVHPGQMKDVTVEVK